MTAASPATQRDQLRRLSFLIISAGIDMLGFAMVLPLLPYPPSSSPPRRRSSARPRLLFRGPAPGGAALGTVSDRYGAAPALLAGLLASAAAFAIFGFANSIWLLFFMGSSRVPAAGPPASRRPT